MFNAHRIDEIMSTLSVADEYAALCARRHQDNLVKPQGALGRLEELVVWLASWQRVDPPILEKIGMLIFVGGHGVAVRGVSAYPLEVTQQMVQTFKNEGAAINQLCRESEIELKVHDFARTTQDFTQHPALSEQEFYSAFVSGMDAVLTTDYNLLCLGEMGIGNTTAAATICYALFGGSVETWVGRGTGLDDKGMERKKNTVHLAQQKHRHICHDPLQVLQYFGGYEIAALAGAILAARQKSLPVLLDGFVVSAAVAPLFCLNASILDHCQVAHRSAETGHQNLLNLFYKTPLLDLGLCLGEGSGAALVLPLLKKALACHTGMFTFTQAQVSQKK